MFEPWIGSKYEADDGMLAGCRLLVLGESHYAKHASEIGTTPAGFTSDVVRWFMQEGHFNLFFYSLAQAALGLPRSRKWQPELAMFWDSVAFYNYVPVLVDGRPSAIGGNNRRPEASMFAAGAGPFREVQARLKPDAVIVCGLELWQWVAPNLDGFSGPQRDVIFYDDGQSVFARVYHPSYRNFKTEYWYPRIHSLVERAAQPRQRGEKVFWRPDQTN